MSKLERNVDDMNISPATAQVWPDFVLSFSIFSANFTVAPIFQFELLFTSKKVKSLRTVFVSKFHIVMYDIMATCNRHICFKCFEKSHCIRQLRCLKKDWCLTLASEISVNAKNYVVFRVLGLNPYVSILRINTSRYKSFSGIPVSCVRSSPFYFPGWCRMMMSVRINQLSCCSQNGWGGGRIKTLKALIY